MKLVALAIVLVGLLGVWLVRYETLGMVMMGGSLQMAHRNRVTGAVCHILQECW